MSDSILWKNFPDEIKPLFMVTGSELASKLGIAAIQDVVVNVMSGQNVRNATEILTKKRIALMNIGVFAAYFKSLEQNVNFVDTLARESHSHLMQKPSPEQSEKQLLQWSIGLTTKTAANVLRSDLNAWSSYIKNVQGALLESSIQAEALLGDVQELTLLGRTDSRVSWLFLTYLCMAIGSQTLALRGSEKSLYGKFFEKLILTGSLTSLGFELATEDTAKKGEFWLSSRTADRESDATLILNDKQLVRFDIGFINSGNPEITLDKVSRFARTHEHFGKTIGAKTVIIVDTVGKGSRIATLAKKVDADVIQMSMGYWPVQLGQILSNLDKSYESPYSSLKFDEIAEYIKVSVKSAPLERAMNYVSTQSNGDTQ